MTPTTQAHESEAEQIEPRLRLNSTSKTVSAIIRKIEREKAALAAHRDRLRDLINELDQIVEDADEAVEDLTRATDALSRML